MKKLLTIVSLAYASQCFGQFNNSIQLTFGSAIPVGDFKATGDAIPGFAFSGIHQQHFKAASKFGIASMIRYQSYWLDNYRLSNQGLYGGLSQSLVGAYIISSTKWKNIAFMVGPFMSIKLNENIFFEPRVLLGYGIAQSPHVEAESPDPSYIYINSASSGSFAGLIGTNFRFDASKRVSITLNLDYFITSSHFSISTFTMNPDNREQKNYEQQIASFTSAFGLAYRF